MDDAVPPVAVDEVEPRRRRTSWMVAAIAATLAVAAASVWRVGRSRDSKPAPIEFGTPSIVEDFRTVTGTDFAIEVPEVWVVAELLTASFTLVIRSSDG
jgi:hypothetical protein